MPLFHEMAELIWMNPAGIFGKRTDFGHGIQSGEEGKSGIKHIVHDMRGSSDSPEFECKQCAHCTALRGSWYFPGILLSLSRPSRSICTRSRTKRKSPPKSVVNCRVDKSSFRQSAGAARWMGTASSRCLRVRRGSFLKPDSRKIRPTFDGLEGRFSCLRISQISTTERFRSSRSCRIR